MHFRHAVVDAAPRVVEKDPAEHSVHVVDAAAALYAPAAHLTQAAVAPATVENDPALQAVHAATLDAAKAVEYVPGGQDKQALLLVAAAAVEYVPALHALHVVAPLPAQLPAAQAMQVESRPPVENAPALHAMHWLLDVYCPGPHSDGQNSILAPDVSMMIKSNGANS